MGRPKKVISNEDDTQIEEVLDELSAADQLVPLIFDKDNLSILLALGKNQNGQGIPFSRLGEKTELGKSQKLVDLLKHLREYGLIKKNIRNYALTDLGKKAAEFAYKLILTINSDSELKKRMDLSGYVEEIEAIQKTK